MTDPAKVPSFTLYNGDKIPCIGMGTFGSDRVSSEEVAKAVSGGIKSGYRLFDCAACYGNEDKIGESFQEAFDAGTVKRNELFIMTKVWNDMHRKVSESCKKSISDLKCGYIDMLFIHWPFPNYHAPFCDVDSRNPDSKPFSVDEFTDTYHQIEELVDEGLVRHIGISNMTIHKLEAVLGKLRIPPSACESEIHPTFQQRELCDYLKAHDILPIGYMPLDHGCHPAIICIKWALQKGHLPIPFSIHNYEANLEAALTEKLTDEEMSIIDELECGNRLVKGQVFLWPEASDWHDLWDEA